MNVPDYVISARKSKFKLVKNAFPRGKVILTSLKTLFHVGKQILRRLKCFPAWESIFNNVKKARPRGLAAGNQPLNTILRNSAQKPDVTPFNPIIAGCYG